MEQRQPITTKQLISRLLEIDPDGNKFITVQIPGDDWYTVYDDFEIGNYNDIIIRIPREW